MDLRQIVMLALQVSIIAMVFGFGLKATTGDLLFVVRRPGLLVRSVLSMFVVMPIVAVALVRSFDFARTLEIVLVALSLSPVPPLLPNRERAAGALMSYGIGLMVTLGLLSVVLIPLGAELLARIFGLPIGVSAATILRLMLAMLVGPLILGVAIRSWAPALAERVADAVSSLGLALLALGSLALLAATFGRIWALIGDGTMLALAIFVVVGLTVGHFLGGPDPDRAGVLALSTACRHPIIAMTIAAANFPEERFGAMVILYLLVNLVLSVPYIAWQKRRAAAAAA